MRNSWRNASWIDLLIVRLEALPFPLWLFYAGLFVLIAALNLLAFPQNSGGTTFQNVYASFYICYIIGLIHLMQRLAASTFDQYKPSFDLPEDQIEQARGRFIIAPAWLGVAILLLGIFSGVNMVMMEEAASATFQVSLFMILVGFLTLTASSVFTTYFLAITIHRLRLIIQFHRQVERVDLFNLESLRAFSRYSSTTAFALLLTILANSPWFIESADELEELIFYIFISLLALVVFLVPLLGLRNKINAARDKRINDLMADMDLIAGKISQAVRQDQLDRVDKLKVGIDGLLLQRDELRKLHTWPWSTATIRAFWSAFLVPIILWVITRVLERFI